MSPTPFVGTMTVQETLEVAVMWLEDIVDPDTSDLAEAREEFAGWDPYVIHLCRKALATDNAAEPPATTVTWNAAPPS